MYYKIDKNKYKSWIDSYFLLFPRLNYIAVSSITGIVIFIIGITWSIFFNFFELYIKTYQIYLLIFGIIWVMCWARWGMNYLIVSLNKLIDRWGIEKREDFIKLNKNLNLLTKNSVLITISLLFTLVIWIWIHFHISRSQIFIPSLFISPILPPGWYESSNLFAKEIFILFAAIIVFFLVATTGTQIIIYSHKVVSTVCEVFNFNMPNIAIQELKPLSIISLRASFSWFFGVAIVLIGVIRGLTPIIWIILCILTLIGLLGFLLPQYKVHKILLKRRDELAEKVSKKYEEFAYKMIKGDLDLDKMKDLFFWNSVYQNIFTSKTWIFDLNILFQLISAALIPFISILVRFLVLPKIF